MSNLSALFGGAEVSVHRGKVWLYPKTSRLFVPKFDMDVVLHLIGAGGGGALIAVDRTRIVKAATGGGGGAYTRKRVTLKKDVEYTFTLGASGVAIQSNVALAQNGNDGGDTSVTGPGLSVVAGGGKGGLIGTGALNQLVLGGIGGVASGGDVNLDGGRGGNISGVSSVGGVGSSQYCSFATGGGGVDLFGWGAETRGGDLLFTGAISQQTDKGSGGGGIGGPATDDIQTNPFAGPTGSAYIDLLAQSGNPMSVTLDELRLFGYVTAITTSGGIWTGGAGATDNGGGGAGGFGGGGGHGASSDSSTVRTAQGGAAGSGGFGGGGGAGVGYRSGASHRSGAGGNGFIAIEVLFT